MEIEFLISILNKFIAHTGRCMFELSITIVQDTDLEQNALSTQNFAETLAKLRLLYKFVSPQLKFYVSVSRQNNFMQGSTAAEIF